MCSQSTTALDKGVLTAEDYVDFLFLEEEKLKYHVVDAFLFVSKI